MSAPVVSTSATVAAPRASAGISLDALRSNYLSNLAALYRRNGALAAALEAIPFARIPRLEAARDGAVTARIAADDEQLVYANSRYEPVAEARRVVDAQPTPENPTFIVAGAGLGYCWSAIEERFDRPVVVAVEEDMTLLKAALCAQDHARTIAEGRLVFITRADKRIVHDTLSRMSADIMLGFQFLTLPPAARCRAGFHESVRALVTDYVSFSRMQITTLVKHARLTCQNIAMNLRDYVRHGGIEALRGKAAGYPAVVIAAGPSLARQLDFLLGLRERAVFIAAQTVYKLLLAKGCPPHFVTSLDFHEMSADFFRDAPAGGDCTLVAEPKAHWSVLDAFGGARRLLHARFADDLLRSAAPQRGSLKAGSTVAHLSFYLAEYLGCDPIILVGQDLCYSEGLYYPPGMPIEEVWRPEMNRFYTPEMKQWERIVRSRPILRTVQDVHGRSAYTDEQLFTYAEQFQADFVACKARVIHAGEAGMRLVGTTPMSLREAAAQFCTRALPTGLLAQDNTRADAARVAAAVAELATRVAEVRKLEEVSEEMLTLLTKLMELTDRPAEFNRLMARVDDLRSLVGRHERTYKLVIDVSQHAELRRLRADRAIGSVEEETAASARLRLRRDRDFVESFRDGCRFLAQMLPQAAERLAEGG